MKRNKMENMNNQITEKYGILVGLKDKPTNLPKGKTSFRGIVFRKRTKIFDEVFLMDLEDYEFSVTWDHMSRENREKYTLEQYRKHFGCYNKKPNRNVMSVWKYLYDEKVGNKLKRKYGDNYIHSEGGFWEEYSVFDLEENRWGDIIHFWGSK
jgi:hypothetical protein